MRSRLMIQQNTGTSYALEERGVMLGGAKDDEEK